MELEEILQMAQDDSDQWVAMVGDILKTYPAAGTLNHNMEQRHTFYHEVLADLRKLGMCKERLAIQPHYDTVVGMHVFGPPYKRGAG